MGLTECVALGERADRLLSGRGDERQRIVGAHAAASRGGMC